MNIFILVIISFFIGIFQYINYVGHDDVSKTYKEKEYTPQESQLRLKLACLKKVHSNMVNNNLLSSISKLDGNSDMTLTSDTTCDSNIKWGTVSSTGPAAGIATTLACEYTDSTGKLTLSRENCKYTLCLVNPQGVDWANAVEKNNCLKTRKTDKYKVYLVSRSADTVSSDKYSLLLQDGVGYQTASDKNKYITPNGTTEITQGNSINSTLDGLSPANTLANTTNPTMLYQVDAFKLADLRASCSNEDGTDNSGQTKQTVSTMCTKIPSKVIPCGGSAALSLCNVNHDPNYLYEFKVDQGCFACTAKTALATENKCADGQVRYSKTGKATIDDGLKVCGPKSDIQNFCQSNVAKGFKGPIAVANTNSAFTDNEYFICGTKTPEEYGCTPCEVLKQDASGNYINCAGKPFVPVSDSDATTLESDDPAVHYSTYKTVLPGPYSTEANALVGTMNDVIKRGCPDTTCKAGSSANFVWNTNIGMFTKYCCGAGQVLKCTDSAGTNCSCQVGCTAPAGSICSYQNKWCPASIVPVEYGLTTGIEGSKDCMDGYKKLYNDFYKCSYCRMPAPTLLTNF